MLPQMEWDLSDDSLGALTYNPPQLSEPPQLNPATANISEQEFSCHCCYDFLVNPTTLTCGHNFCRHCLALWWESSHKNECPECREKWEGFPKINILLRYAFHRLAISGLTVWDIYILIQSLSCQKEIHCKPLTANKVIILLFFLLSCNMFHFHPHCLCQSNALFLKGCNWEAVQWNRSAEESRHPS